MDFSVPFSLGQRPFVRRRVQKAQQEPNMHGILLHTLNAIFVAQFLALLFGNLPERQKKKNLFTDFCALLLANFFACTATAVGPNSSLCHFYHSAQSCSNICPLPFPVARVERLWAFCNVIGPHFALGNKSQLTAIALNDFLFTLGIPCYFWGIV